MFKLNEKKPIFVGMSSAASWAWGTSLIVGMEIAQQRGITAFLIWAITNALTLAVFGALSHKGIIRPELYKNKIIKAFAILIQLFCLIIQLNIINQVLGTWIESTVVSYIITSVIGITFVLLMLKHGLPTSMKTDIFQWGVALVSICIILAIALTTGAERIVFPISTEADISWAIWSACILLSGPIGDVQHWQRANADESRKGYYFGAVFFAIYMALIFFMANFHFNNAMNIVLLIATLCVTTSTIDSIAVALHEMKDKYFGTEVALVICLAWGAFIGMGVMNIWSNFGVVRVGFAIVIVICSLVITSMLKNKADGESN